MKSKLLRLAAAVALLGALGAGSAVTRAAAEETVKLCGLTTCGNGQPCILCGMAQSQYCQFHGNCQ